ALLRLDPMFDPLRNDPRFQKLVASSAQEVGNTPTEYQAYQQLRLANDNLHGRSFRAPRSHQLMRR
ncbi:MAG TPA: hypothetical protein VGY75_05060, partial [Candidatus Udaeobacter sp.]|nr:hypothetical protein [Candidatus Udaeobacter sp.]